MGAGEHLERGREALERWEWAEARAAFESALADSESADALMGLQQAVTHLGEGRLAVETAERAYRLYRGSGEDEGAAHAALTVAMEALGYRGESAVAAGWIERARAVLRAHPASELHALADALEGYLAWAFDKNVQRGVELTERALAFAIEAGDADSEMMAKGQLGLIRVCGGELEAGMRLLDEATAAAVAGDLSSQEIAGIVTCFLVTACAKVRDLDRMEQWSRHVMSLSADWVDRSMFSYPATEHAVVLAWRGRWREAEEQLRGVIADMEGRPAAAALATLRLAELRRRQGRLDESGALLREVDRLPGRAGLTHLSLIARAALALDAGELRVAAEGAERALRLVPENDPVERAEALEILAAARAASGDANGAEPPAAELAALAELVGTGPVRAAASHVRGAIEMARDDRAAARIRFEEARDRFAAAGAPHEAARAGMDLARCLAALGSSEDGVAEATSAHAVFAALGAERDRDAAAWFLAEHDAPARTRGDGSLTSREIEVLRLIGHGRSNEEIAEELVLSVRTVERHVSNIYLKLGATGRTARAVATAYAHTHGVT